MLDISLGYLDQYTQAGTPCPRCGGQVLQDYEELICLQCGFSLGGDDGSILQVPSTYKVAAPILFQALSYGRRQQMARRR